MTFLGHKVTRYVNKVGLRIIEMVSRLLRVVGVLSILGAAIAVFFPIPIKASDYSQEQLYASELYQYLDKQGVEARAFVANVIPDKANTDSLVVSFFDTKGKRTQARISMVKVKHNHGDLVNVVFDPERPHYAKLAAYDELQMNWGLVGWLVVMGVMLFWIGAHRSRVSGGIE